MENIKRLNFLLVFMFILASLTSVYVGVALMLVASDPKLDFDKGGLTISYFFNGNHIATKSADSSSPLIIVVKSIMDKKSEYWKKSFISYAPNVCVYGRNFNLNVTHRALVLNFVDDFERTRQIVCRIEAYERKEFIESLSKCMKEN